MDISQGRFPRQCPTRLSLGCHQRRYIFIYADLGSLKTGSAPVFVTFARPIVNPASSIARAFITGYTAKSGNEIFIRAFDKSVSANRLELGVQVGGSLEITSAQINYIVFSPNTVVFASYGGGVLENNFVTSKVYNLQKFIHSSPYGFYGLANLRHSGNGVAAVSSSLTNDFYLRLDSIRQFNELYLSYIMIGVNPSSYCAGCTATPIVGPTSCVT